MDGEHFMENPIKMDDLGYPYFWVDTQYSKTNIFQSAKYVSLLIPNTALKTLCPPPFFPCPRNSTKKRPKIHMSLFQSLTTKSAKPPWPPNL